MNERWKVFFALAVAFLMLATVFPMQCADNADTVDDLQQQYVSEKPPLDHGWTDEEKNVVMKDKGNGTYVISIPFLEDRFGLKPHDADPNDPMYGTMGITLPEIHSYFGSNSRNSVYEPEGVVTGNGPTVTYGVSRGVEFSAGFSSRYLETGVEDIFTFGITVDGRWFIQNTTNTDAHFRNADESQYLGHLLTEYEQVSQMQGSNLFHYAVGNFIPDPKPADASPDDLSYETEEFALYLGDKIVIYDCVENDYMWPVAEIPVPDMSMNGNGYRIMPVSMAAGDTDGDRLDEIVLTVEYAASYESNWYAANSEHHSYLFLFNHGDTQVRYGELKTAVYNEYYGINERLDTVMTSVCTADYDFDKKAEIIVGGYLWDNGNCGHDALQNPNYFSGELFLASMDPNAGSGTDLTMEGLKRLMDDAGDDDPDNSKYSKTKYDIPATNGNHTKHREYKDHYNDDTSLMLEDWSDNNFGFCRSPNWTNWTIPMAALGLTSMGDIPYIYFDNCLYTIDPESRISYNCAIPLEHYQDNNNCQCGYIGVSSLFYRENYDYMSYDDLYRFVGMDRHSEDGSTMHWSHEITYLDMGDPNYLGDETVRSKTVDTFECDDGFLYEPFMACLSDLDPTDKVDVRFLGVVSSMMDPTVLAAISGIPYDQDLKACMKDGSQDIGVTEYYISESTTEGVCGQAHVWADFNSSWTIRNTEIGFKFGADFLSEWDAGSTVSITRSFIGSEDAVALYLMPFDVYTYAVTKNVDGEPVTSDQTLYRFLEPLMITVPYAEYVKLINQYNESMAEYYKETGFPFQKLDIIHFDHTRGDVASYNEDYGSECLFSQYIGYSGAGESEATSVTVEFSDYDTLSMMFGGNINIYGSHTGLANLKTKGGEGGAESEGGKTVTDMTGTGYRTQMTGGLKDSYNWETADAWRVTSQYGMTAHMWAVPLKINNAPYVYVGYTVDSHTSACKNGWIAPDIKFPGSEKDENDLRNPDDDYLYMRVKIPGDVREDLLADRYELQYLSQGKLWVDWRKTVSDEDLQMRYEIERGTDAEGDPILVEMTEDFVPSVNEYGETVDSYYWVKVSGLEKMRSPFLYFRLVGYDGDGNAHPSIKTLCPTSEVVSVTHVVDDFRISGDDITVPHIEGLTGKTVLLLQTEMYPPGSVVNIFLEDENGLTNYHGMVPVGLDGTIILEADLGAEDEGPLTPMDTALVFIGILLALAAVVYVLRKC